MPTSLLDAVKICLRAEEERQKKLKPGAPASTYCAQRIAMLRDTIDENSGPRVGDGTGDAALAIGEHAFGAGWDACCKSYGLMPGRESGQTKYDAWSDYDPPEDIKALS